MERRTQRSKERTLVRRMENEQTQAPRHKTMICHSPNVSPIELYFLLRHSGPFSCSLETQKWAINFGCDTITLFFFCHFEAAYPLYFDLRALHLSRISTFTSTTSSLARWMKLRSRLLALARFSTNSIMLFYTTLGSRGLLVMGRVDHICDGEEDG